MNENYPDLELLQPSKVWVVPKATFTPRPTYGYMESGICPDVLIVWRVEPPGPVGRWWARYPRRWRAIGTWLRGSWTKRMMWVFLALALAVAVVALASCQPAAPTKPPAVESRRFVLVSEQGSIGGGTQNLVVICDTRTNKEYLAFRVFQGVGIAPLGTVCEY